MLQHHSVKAFFLLALFTNLTFTAGASHPSGGSEKQSTGKRVVIFVQPGQITPAGRITIEIDENGKLRDMLGRLITEAYLKNALGGAKKTSIIIHIEVSYGAKTTMAEAARHVNHLLQLTSKDNNIAIYLHVSDKK